MSITNIYTIVDNEATAAAANVGAIREADPFQVFVSSGSDLVPMFA
jgi:hypothetical protein